MVGNVASRILGMVREVVIADLFGGGSTVDAFRIASNVFAIVYDMLVSGSISAAMVPVFSEYARVEKWKELRHIVGNLFVLVALILGLAVLVLEILASPLAWLLAVGFDRNTHDLAVLMIRIVLPGVAFMSMGAVLMSAHYALRRYLFPAFAAPALNLAVIAGALILAPYLGIPSLAVGMALGALVLMLWQAAGLRDMGLLPKLCPLHPAVMRIFRLYLPVVMGLVVSAVGIVIDRNLASRTGAGSIAAMSYATTLVQFALGVVGAAISLAVLPVLSRQAADGDLENFRSTLTKGLISIAYLILPATALLAVLGDPVISLLFQHGAFSEADHQRTLMALGLYLPGLPFSAIDQLLIYAFYARKDTLTPVLVGVAGVGVYLAVALTLIGPLGMPGLVIANSVQLISHTVIMALLLRRTIPSMCWSGLAADLGKAMVAATACAATALIAFHLMPARSSVHLMERLLLVTVPGVLGAGAYVIVALAVGSGESIMLLSEPLRRLWRRERPL